MYTIYIYIYTTYDTYIYLHIYDTHSFFQPKFLNVSMVEVPALPPLRATPASVAPPEEQAKAQRGWRASREALAPDGNPRGSHVEIPQKPW
jgi:hypothetical protein